MKQFVIGELASGIMRVFMTTGETVTAALYDASGSVVPLTSGATTEIGATGIFSWPLSDITTPPTAYQDYLVVFTGSVTGSIADEFRVAGWPETLINGLIASPVGASSVTITVQDQDTNPIGSVGVGIYDSTNTVLQGSGVTAADGTFSFSMNDGTYKVRLFKNQVNFSAVETLTVSGTTSTTYTGEALTIPAPVESNVNRVYSYAFNQSGSNAVLDINATAEIKGLPFNSGSGYHIGDKVKPTFSTSDGFFYWDLPYSAVVYFRADAFGIKGQATVPSQATTDLQTLTLV